MNTVKKIKFQKIIYYGFFLMSWLSHSQAQTPSIGTDMPEVIPPSPTVAALMKFEEVPVNLYTGIPNVSVPIFSTKTKGRGLDFSVSLNYHPGSAAVHEHASYTGLGWSLMAGGTISRTVRGYPDEVNNGVNFGIYQDNLGTNSNVYYTAFNGLGFNLPPHFRFDALEKGKYDTEHDLWQFNFMGHTGKFIIVKNLQNGLLEVQKLDQNIYKIDFDYAFNNINNKYTFNNFTITDDKGFKYFFDISETTSSSSNAQTTDAAGIVTNSLGMNQQSYLSSFHLSKVKDIDNQTLISLSYQPVSEVYQDVSYEYHQYSIETLEEIEDIETSLIQSNTTIAAGPVGTMVTNWDYVNAELSKLEPPFRKNVSIRSVATQKIMQIDIKDRGVIDFEHESGRSDTWFTSTSTSVKLKSITIKNNLTTPNNRIQKYVFEYHYLTNNLGTDINLSRLALKEIKTYGKNSTDFQSQKFTYTTADYSWQFLGVDYWGNYNANKFYCNTEYNQYQTNKNFSNIDLLETISYPTGGYAKFNFGSNTYSFEGSQVLEDFYSNPDNQKIFTNTYNFSVNTSAVSQCVSLPLMNNETIVYEIYLNTINSNNENAVLEIKKNGEIIGVVNSCISEITGEAGDNIEICYKLLDIAVGNTFQAEVTVIRKYKKLIDIQEFVYGGGIRINSIDYYEKGGILFKTKYYDYKKPNTSKSSGSLAYKKPLFKYNKTRTAIFKLSCNEYGTCIYENLDYDVEYLTTSNLLAAKQTSGGFVGYKYVTVSETANGKSEHEFISPFDVPETYHDYNTNYPFIPTDEVDYKRGLEISSKIIDNNGLVIKEVFNDYMELDIITKITGLRLFSIINCPGVNEFPNHLMYQVYIEQCQALPSNQICQFLCGANLDWIQQFNITNKFGRMQLQQSITKEYSHLSSGEPLLTQRTETYTYHNINKKIATVTTTDSSGDVTLQEFNYLNPNGDAVNNRISDIQEIKVKKNEQLISTSRINYQVFSNFNIVMPRTILVSKGSQPLEIKVTNMHNDTHGNPTEVRQENGMAISYLWGYNKSLPIAKIENATNSQIANALSISSVNNLNETNFETINNLRTLLPNALVTTIKHIPLVGVKEVTDPKGDKISYEYDNFNRLKTVKDKDGNLVSENQYHYRP